MPVPSSPTRPHLVRGASPECRTYVSRAGIIGIPIGLVTSAIGLYVILAFVWSVWDLFSAGARSWADIGEGLLKAVGLFALGSGFIVCGVVLVWALRATLDRARDVVVVRSGPFGFKRRERRLSDFRSVVVLPSQDLTTDRGDLYFDIALLDASGVPMVICLVTRSHELARQVAQEISEFLKLPVTSRETVAPCPA